MTESLAKKIKGARAALAELRGEVRSVDGKTALLMLTATLRALEYAEGGEPQPITMGQIKRLIGEESA